MLSSAEIRQQFLDFFRQKGHQVVPSAPIVVKNDPTLLFTNAGMNQFKDYFLGNKKPQHTRVADTQKCLRVSGKHNDLEEVGVDTYHHTMFEMLGNWSFGDYFKKEAIAWSWELLTEVYKLDSSRLYVTIFEGDEKEGLPKDEEAYNEWKKVIAEDRILLGNKKDNFWEMGDTGPCGPCTEIHVDCRGDDERKVVDGKMLVNNDHPQVIEIWNNVFIQFNRVWSDKKGFDDWNLNTKNPGKEERAQKILECTRLEELPAKHVDTGMGFERLVRVLQGKQSNYDTDIFTGTIAETEKITGKNYDYSDSRQAIAFRVISDHIRAIAFTIADGQLPSNTGAGYVIRRILRRAVRYYFSYLDYKQPLLHQLMPLLARQFETVFPELQHQVDFVSKVVKEEEHNFLRTIDAGIKRFSIYTGATGGSASSSFIMENINDPEEDSKVTASYISLISKYEFARKRKEVNGEFAFELNDTYGFPYDLTELMAKEIGWHVDKTEYDSQLQQQKSRSRAATAIDTEDWIVLDENGNSEFVGYDLLETISKVVKYRKVKAKGKEAFQLVLDNTPFYAESGGQVGDTGSLDFDGEVINVLDTKKENNLFIHFTDKLPANIETEAAARVDVAKRKSTAVHHSATHLLHAALRKVLGTHVAQKGSLVNAEHLRFDFSHFAKVTDEEIARIEQLVNEKIRENIPVVIKELPKEQALQLGAMALFGEKYGDVVRVVIIDPAYSVELCGGTHVGHTGELGFFKITHESAVAAGVRRVEAVSGKSAAGYMDEQLAVITGIKEVLKNPKDIRKAIENLAAENSELKKKIESLEAKQLNVLKQQLLDKQTTFPLTEGLDAVFIGDVVEVGSADALKKLCFDLQKDISCFAIVLAANVDGKASVALALDQGVIDIKKFDAPTVIKQHIAPLIKGGGGGQKTLATAGGQDTSNLEKVIDVVKSLL
ncbi:alanine--tRNA ligase [Foetidibacter luteolus]|uniref:alanine--tRNA ligase n=1 Tax=Foetidibacter luteolus TaxID=2608880 RepID=UPI00129BF897|nr:alanine--tRNA ligase [Foetidibacter luteolus]